MLKIESTDLIPVKIVTAQLFADARGVFSETWTRRAFAEAGIDVDFVQDNQSITHSADVIRGLHFQSPPFAQAKLVRVASGSIRDVVVDLRRSSPTFGRHIAIDLSCDDGRQIFVPVGFAHGFRALEPRTIVVYKVTAYYSPQHDHGLAFDDPALGIDWGMAPAAASLSDKDRRHPRLADLAHCFD